MLRYMVALAVGLLVACSAEDPQVIVIHDEDDPNPQVIIDNNSNSSSSSSATSSSSSSSSGSSGSGSSSNSNRNSNPPYYGGSDAGYGYDSGYDAGFSYDAGSDAGYAYDGGGSGPSITIWVTGTCYVKVKTAINTWEGSLSDGQWIIKIGPGDLWAKIWIEVSAIKVEGSAFTIWMPGVMPPYWPTATPQWFQGYCPWNYFTGKIWVNILIP